MPGALLQQAQALPAEYTAEQLLRRAVHNARARHAPRGQKHPRWLAVADTFGIGSDNAATLCRWAGVDPGELVSR